VQKLLAFYGLCKERRSVNEGANPSSPPFGVEIIELFALAGL
jgi:hypothetical protein